MTKTFLIASAAAAALMLTACGGGDTPAESPEPDVTPTEAEASAPEPETASLPEKLVDAAPGNYSLEKTHAFLTAYVGHGGGISDYRISLTDFDAKLVFDPANPAASKLTVTINPLGIETNYPGDYKAGHADSPYESWNEDVAKNPNWLNGDEFPEITFEASELTRTGDYTGTMTGLMDWRGVSGVITFDVTYNGTGNAPWYGERDLIGFDALATINRSDWGSTAYIPNITDEVRIEFSGEFLQDE